LDRFVYSLSSNVHFHGFRRQQRQWALAFLAYTNLGCRPVAQASRPSCFHLGDGHRVCMSYSSEGYGVLVGPGGLSDCRYLAGVRETGVDNAKTCTWFYSRQRTIFVATQLDWTIWLVRRRTRQTDCITILGNHFRISWLEHDREFARPICVV